MQRFYRQSTRVLSAVVLILGVVLMAVTIHGDGGPLARGVLLGAMLAAVGAARLVLVRHAPPRR